MQRRKARQLLLRFLFQQDFRELDLDALLDEYAFEDAFISETLRGVHKHQAELDRLIAARARGWSLDRLATVDRNILRLAMYELLHTGTPAEVVINEAVELAKRFGTEHSAAFVNGVLDQTWKDKNIATTQKEHR